MAVLSGATDVGMYQFLTTIIMAVGGAVAWIWKARKEARSSTLTELRQENERIRGVVEKLEVKYAQLEERLNVERDANYQLKEEAMRSALRAEDAQRRVEELIAENNALREQIRRMGGG